MIALPRRRLAGLLIVVVTMGAGLAMAFSDDTEGALLTRSEGTVAEGSVESPTSGTTDLTTATWPVTTLPPRASPALLGPTATGALDGRLIVVDPGHNGRNFEYADTTREDSPYLCNTTGTTSPGGVTEAQINWAIGRELAAMLNGLGAAVLLTHADNDGFGPCADERGALARDNDADALISLHADGASGGSGFHVIHPAVHPDLSAATVARSATLASLIRDALVAVGGRPANYVGRSGLQERGDLANLNSADRPSVLVELGNLRSSIDSRMLEEQPSQRIIAAAIGRALLAYFGEPTDALAVRGDVTGDDFSDSLPDYSTTTTTTTSSTTTVSTTTTSVPLTKVPLGPDPPTTEPSGTGS